MQMMPVVMVDGVRSSLTDFATDDRTRLMDAMVKHRNYLYRMAYSIVRHAEDAEDAVQAAYLSAWTGWASFRGQSTLKTWLTTIVMNKALSELRTKRRQTCVSMDADPALLADAEWRLSAGQVTPEQLAIREQSVRRVTEQMAYLPEHTQCMVMLRYGQELSVEEIAQSRGTSRASVKGHLVRGCKALRKGVSSRRMLMA
ncbi:RNA polymerase sigma factor, sigma-70 family [Terriglobus roseus DSM 18391]|uniref:RNA polymerase sigma factor, sigma-70 family n=1 Tax=Terriglobus roseus (strain DSM 18391 / NRRL B-41598 / KBS 63) TaxID=926566 RepID=I3ZEW4_TERRK|nr:sigma-70 family RNA polymerase sigma factor [Terriglobus roseus]AFL87782.1 RNA polymerase sigma factor, sigma-70 family [Terriglobus roseus DSM 18391]